MKGCQNYGPFLGPEYSTAPSILGNPKGDHNLTTTHIPYPIKLPIGYMWHEPFKGHLVLEEGSMIEILHDLTKTFSMKSNKFW